MEKNTITTLLRGMKLPGIAEGLDRRLAEAQKRRLGHLEFLALILQDERVARDGNLVRKNIRMAGFGQERTFEGFDFSFNEQHLPRGVVNDLRTGEYLSKGRNVVIAGPPGVGKTHIAKALGHEACRQKHSVIFRRTGKIFRALATAKSDYHFERAWKPMVRADLLIFDDFALRRFEPKEVELLYNMIEERQGLRSIILTSNRPTADWLGAFPDQVVGGAILDRLVAGATKIYVKAQARSYRGTEGITAASDDDKITQEAVSEAAV